ncbi:hypothetical protein GCM10017786_09260 [Amycolatopsis deserti]|uniref:Uncharacterized protein n=1 Tax=Amycolatopsis deserti TaxID=185696 RepID=A0ABQ3IEX6_9PSEU|nr:hypothetical protein GCM10017786_09260 [Amycolatopsis deserti]
MFWIGPAGGGIRAPSSGIHGWPFRLWKSWQLRPAVAGFALSGHERERLHVDVDVRLPSDCPELTHGAARGMLRLLCKAADVSTDDQSDGAESGRGEIGQFGRAA